MEINKTQQAVSISKAEEDQRLEVTKAKPIGQNQTPDSFETGGLKASGKAGNGPIPENPCRVATSTEPEKKAGQITGGILVKQMTAARLGGSGIKSPESTQSKEQTGTRELNEREQEIASGRAPVTEKPPEQSGGMTGDARTRIENSRDAVMQQMTDLYGTPRDGAGSSSSGSGSSGGGTGSVGGGPGRVTAEQRAKFEEMIGGDQGPQSGASKIAEMEAQMTGGGMNGLAQRTDMAQALLDSVGVQDTSSSSGPDKGMIANKGYTTPEERKELADHMKAQDAAAKKAAEKPPAATEKSLTDKVKDAAAFVASVAQDALLNWGSSKSPVPLPPIPPDVDTGKNLIGGAGAVGTLQNKTYEQKVDEKGGNSETTPSAKDGDPEQDQYGKEQYEKFKQLKNKALGKYNLEDIPKAPKIQGDKDPTEDAVANDAAGTELSFIAQQGEYGLVGQPNEDRQVGGSGNVSTGGNIDYEDQGGWGGREIEEDPSDVDVTPGANEELPPAANQPSEEESKSSKRLITSQPIAAEKEDLSRIKLEK